MLGKVMSRLIGILVLLGLVCVLFLSMNAEEFTADGVGPRVALVCATKNIHLHDASEKARFAIRNASSREVKIEEVVKSCGCARLSGIPHAPVPPSGEFEITGGFAPPVVPGRSVSIRIRCEGDRKPLILTMSLDATRDRRLPRFARVPRINLGFLELKNQEEVRPVEVQTLEYPDVDPWLPVLHLGKGGESIGEFKLVDFEDKSLKGDAIRRTYVYQFVWKKLPPAGEFQFPVVVDVEHGKQVRETVGMVFGRSLAKGG
ncbi:hypothetical protein Pan216_50000 [Planctomycetes bacterium Pan216]|uniref:DUF1573 domain-containing protein n=1 Tax=Kolteria novifilia TaxID=2527975 RepID=A0A518BAV1_9BACT|nr:hypothetical protein Pan216_50000 [Planctomycetes bacterium Pan216]